MFIFIYLFIFGCAGSSFAVRRLSLVAASRGYSLVVVCGLLTAVEQGSGTQASVVVVCGLHSCSSHALEHRFNSCGTQALVALQHVGSSQTRD